MLISVCGCPARRHRRFVADAVSRKDPTGTTGTRKRFEADLVRRFVNIRRMIFEAIVKLDVLGLKPNAPMANRIQSEIFTRVFSHRDMALLSEAIRDGMKLTSFDALPVRRAFAFSRPADKVNSFIEWLYQMQREGILAVMAGTPVRSAADRSWMNLYIDAAYRKGLRDAGERLVKAGVIQGSGRAFAQAAFNSPMHADRVGLIYTRAYNELEGISDTMSAQISRVLALGMAEGRGPLDIARDLMDRVDKIGIVRARTLARTETISAHAEASLNAYEEAGVQGVELEAEWATAGDNAVCPRCEEMEGKVFIVAESRGLIPLHPNCRCAWLPVVSLPGGGGTADATWNEEDHPRVPAGQSSGGQFTSKEEGEVTAEQTKLIKREVAMANAKSYEITEHRASYILGSLEQGFDISSELTKQETQWLQIYSPELYDQWKNDQWKTKLLVAASGKLEWSLTGELTLREDRVLRDYTNASWSMNEALRKGDASDISRFGKDISALDGAFSKVSLHGPMTVYRGGGSEFFKAISQLPVGTEFIDNGFMSTTLDREIANNFERTSTKRATLTILLPKGAKALPLASISNYPHEKEVLLARGSRLRITSIEAHKSYAEVRAEYLGASVRDAEWNEEDHPRVPAGSSGGGQFTSKEGEADTDWKTEGYGVSFERADEIMEGVGQGKSFEELDITEQEANWLANEWPHAYYALTGGSEEEEEILDPSVENDWSAHEEVAQQSLSSALTDDEKLAIGEYTRESVHFNYTLRGRRSNELSEDQRENLKHLDSSFGKTSLSEPLTVYRGAGNTTFERLKNLPVGSEIVDLGFMSTSASRDQAGMFGGSAQFIISLPVGAKALPIAHLSLHAAEMEVLIARGSRFKLTGSEGPATFHLEYLGTKTGA